MNRRGFLVLALTATLTGPALAAGETPTQLVEAFRSTLEEVGDADLLLHVVDGSHPDPEGDAWMTTLHGSMTPTLSSASRAS